VSDGFDGGRDFKAAKVRAAKNISSVRRRGNQPNVDRDGRVEANAMSFYS
jgi:hypothetical protein